MAHNQNRKIAGNFQSKGVQQKLIPRLMIRSYVYYHVFITGEIMDLSKNSVTKVLNYFNLHENEKSKIKNIVRVILKRDKNLPPIIFNKEASDSTRDSEIALIIKRKAIGE